MLNKSLSVLIFFLFSLHAFAQEKSIADSLLLVINKQNDDTLKVNNLVALSKNYLGNDLTKAMKYAIDAKVLSEKIKFKSGNAYALKNIGIAYLLQGNYPEALEYYKNSLSIFQQIGHKNGQANMLNNIGTLYFNNGDDANALDYYLKSLEIAEQTNNKLRIATALANIANVYLNKKATLDKALIYYKRALPISEQLGDANIIGSTNAGIGEVYFAEEKYDSALIYFKKSKKDYEGTEYLPYALNRIGEVFEKRGEFNEAIKYHKEALDTAQKLDFILDMIQSLNGLGKCYRLSGDNELAISVYRQSQSLADSMGLKSIDLKNIYDGMKHAYSDLGDYKNAFSYQELLLAIKDTLYNLDTDKKLGTLQFEFDLNKKQGELDKKEQEINRQKLVRNGFIGGFGIVLLFAGVFFLQRNRISKEKKRSDELLLNILPEETAEELKTTGTAKTKSFDLVTVMFTDFKNFTQASEILTAEELVNEINYCYSAFDRIISKYGIEKIKTIGDSYMCAGGLPVPTKTHPEDVVSAGLEMQNFILSHKEDRIKNNQTYFDLRLGIHTGPVVAGIVGIKKFAYDIWGDTVNTASRMESSGEIGKVNISGFTYELVKDKFTCTHRGKIQAKNKGEIDMYFVES